MRDFITFLNEDGTAANVTGGNANVDSFLGQKAPGNDQPQKKKKDGSVAPPGYESDPMKVLSEGLAAFEIPNYEYSLRMNRATHFNLANYTAMVKDLQDHGITIHACDCDPKSLKPTQRNFDWEKVNTMIDNQSYMMPVITSEDGFVIDGHHRWLAACKDDAPIIACRMIKLGITDALDWLKDKEYPRNNEKIIVEGERYVPGVGMIGGASDEYPEEYEINAQGEYMPKAKITKYNKKRVYSNGTKIQHFHQVEFKDKEDAKKEGMKWDPKEKGWFHEHLPPSKTSKFKYVKSVRYDKLDPNSNETARTEWIRPEVDNGARDQFTFGTEESSDVAPTVADDQTPDEQNLQFVHDVSYMHKENAKAEGMKWDPVSKHWYHSDPEKSKDSKFAYKKTVPSSK